MEAIFRTRKYLKGTPRRGPNFKQGLDKAIEVYANANLVIVHFSLKTSHMENKKQSVVARSSAEAELRSTAHGICEALWLKCLLENWR